MSHLHRIVSALLLVTLAACGAEPGVEEAVEPAAGPPVESAPRPAFSCGGWRPLDGGTTASLRGLSAVSAEIAWISGTGGTWGRTLDGGASWRTGAVPGAEELDFRDVDAFDAVTAYLMSAGPGERSRIYKSVDGGETWELQHVTASPEAFFDGMAFWTRERGVLYGDPVASDPVGRRFVVLTTADGGATWSGVPAEAMPPALNGEAGFAASGSGIAVAPGGHAWFGTGGPAARVFRSTDYGRSWTVASTAMRSGAGSAGIFSLAFADSLRGVAVGGDYGRFDEVSANAARTEDGGLTWTVIEGSPPGGYRSAVAFAPGHDGRVLIAAGTSGSDLSLDGGVTWTSWGVEALNAIGFGGEPCAGWAAGPEGTIARLGAR